MSSQVISDQVKNPEAQGGGHITNNKKTEFFLFYCNTLQVKKNYIPKFEISVLIEKYFSNKIFKVSH